MKLRSAQDGQSMLEFSLVVMLLAVIVLALVDFAYVFQTYVGLINAVNVGATYGAQCETAAIETAEIEAVTLSETSGMRCEDMEVSSSVGSDPYDAAYKMVTVSASCAISDLMAIPDSINHVTVSWSTSRRVYHVCR